MINSPKGNRTDVSGVMFRKLLVLRSLHTCKQTSWRKEKINYPGTETYHCNRSNPFIYVDMERLHHATGTFE